MKKKFRDISNLNLDIIKKLKLSARNAESNELDVNYIIEEGKCVIIDNRYFCEISIKKEGDK